MLILKRREGEAICAGSEEQINAGTGIVFRVLGNERGEVTIGIEAPKDIVLVREELLSRKEVGR